MGTNFVHVNYDSNIPLFGVDFLGIIDRGTNIIEIKPITTCNLKCKYCFVRAGDFATNFIVKGEYLLDKLTELIRKKGNHDIEVHIAPYGEALLYPEIIPLIKGLKSIQGIITISMQSNGLLLTEKIIQELQEAGLTRINISLNTLDEEKARYLCNCANYGVKELLQNIDRIIKSKINLIIVPVWFPKENDEDIEQIIEYTLDIMEKEGLTREKLRLGIQKYLIYKTGRKLKKIRPKTWKYFYDQLRNLEKKYNLPLILTPEEFGIHKREKAIELDLKKGEIINVRVVSKGRWNNECIGKISEDYGIKILLNRPIKYSEKLLGKEITVKILKANYKDNIITAFFPID